MFNRKWKWGLAVLLTAAATISYAVWPYWNADTEDQVDRLIGLLHLRPGMVAAEVGAGQGKMTAILARRLGPAAQVYSTEIEPDKVERIKKTAAEAGVQNVTALQAGVKETKLPKDCCDAIFMRRVSHHITDPAAFTAELFAALRPGGRVAVIDFAPRGWMLWLRRPQGVAENRAGHGIPAGVLAQESHQRRLRVRAEAGGLARTRLLRRVS